MVNKKGKRVSEIVHRNPKEMAMGATSLKYPANNAPAHQVTRGVSAIARCPIGGVSASSYEHGAINIGGGGPPPRYAKHNWGTRRRFRILGAAFSLFGFGIYNHAPRSTMFLIIG